MLRHVIASLTATLATAAVLVLTVLPASAASVTWVTDNGGVLVTSAPLHPGEVITRGGVAYRVVFTRPDGQYTVFRTVPAVTSSGSFTVLG